MSKLSLSSKDSGTARKPEPDGDSDGDETGGAGVIGKGAKVNLQCHDTCIVPNPLLIILSE